MASILDIAKKAGVSHGTVSNVLNKKGNVSANKIKLVEAAAMELNYFANNQAKTLRRGQSDRIALIVASFKIEEHLNLFNGLNQYAYPHGITVDLYEAPSTQSKLRELFASFGVSQYMCVLTIGVKCEFDYQGVVYNLDQLIDFKTKNSFILNHPSLSDTYIKYDMDYDSVQAVLKEPELVFIYKDTYTIFKNICNFYGLPIHSKVSLFAEEPNYSADIMHVTKFFDFGKRIAKALIEEANLMELKLSIFTYDKFESRRFDSPQPIRIVSNKNPSIVALQKIVQSFTSKTNIAVEIEILDHNEIYDLINSPRIKDYDFVRIDLSIYPYFAHDKFIHLPQLQAFEGKDDIYNKLIEKVVGKELLSKGVPFDTSIQTMFYRKDILDDELFKRLYYEEMKEIFEIPKTIENYVKMGKFILKQKDFNVSHANAMNINDPNVISSDFLLIYYGLGGTLIHDTGMEITPKIGMKALEFYKELASVSLRNTKEWFTQAIVDYGVGNTSSIFGYSNQIQNVASYDVLETTEVSMVPGSKPMLGGGILAMTHESERNLHFLKWFLNPYTKYMLAQHNGVPTNGQLMDQEFIAKKFYHLNETFNHIGTAIRETYDSNGNPINIYKYEHILGEILRDNMDASPNRILKLMNDAIKQEWIK